MATVLYPRCLLPYDSKGELWKLLFQLCSHKDKEAYMIKGAVGYGKEKEAKTSFFFFQKSTLLQV